MAHRINFKAIKEAASFERVLSYYGVALRGHGDQRKALCPFHADTKPSLNVNLRKRVFNCYPCGDGGDIIKFVAKKEYPTSADEHLLEAAEKLAEICGIPLPENAAEPSARPAEKAKLPASENVAPATSASPPASGDAAGGESPAANPPLTFELKVDPTHPYLTERGLSADSIEAFGLGYCVSEKSFMRQRILIPIHDHRAHLVAYAGRWPGDSGWPDGAAKYLLPPKFQKMRVLFNLHRVIEGMRKGQWPDHEEHVVLVEGFFGVFAVHALAPSVALMGSVLSADHLELLSQTNIRSVTLLLDGPSITGTLGERHLWDDRVNTIIHILATRGFFVRARKLEAGEQP